MIVLQGASEHAPVTTSPYRSLQSLANTPVLRDSESLTAVARVAGFEPRRSRTRTLPSGKRFDILSFGG